MGLIKDRLAGLSVSIAGPKGGVGKSFVSANLACTIAKSGDVNVQVYDTAGNDGTLHHYLRTVPPTELLEKTSVPHLRIASVDISRQRKKQIKKIVDQSNDVKVIDLPSKLLSGGSETSLAVDLPILLTTPEPSSIELCYKFIRELFVENVREIVGENSLTSIGMKEELLSTQVDPITTACRVRERLAKERPVLADKLTDHLFDKKIGMILNMARDSRNALIPENFGRVCRLYYGYEILPLGIISYDDKVTNSVLGRKIFLEEHNSSETSFAFSEILTAIKEIDIKGRSAVQMEMETL